ncbi:MAG TPA: SPOR domain-containing protein, partial [Candidatus Limnocylindrales bacterium]|nr:SPOR domain-containing protein [Candidatus Limnocylindrales bacterium]
MSDEGFHEIQLNGKQLVFLFMSATVVAVVIFLCGVIVGRGVPTRTVASIDAPEHAALDPTASVQQAPAAQAVASTGNALATAQETLTYPGLLEDPNPPAETLNPPVEPAAAVPQPVVAPRPAPVAAKPAIVQPAPVAGGLPPSREASADRGQASGQPRVNAPVAAAPKPAAVRPAPVALAPKPVLLAPPPPAPAVAPRPVAAAPVPAPATTPPVTPAVAGTLAEPAGTGFVVQVAAVRQRAEADTIARRLSTKGYPAFVTTAGANFRVRVGKYTDRREAESIAGRLEKEER